MCEKLGKIGIIFSTIEIIQTQITFYLSSNTCLTLFRILKGPFENSQKSDWLFMLDVKLHPMPWKITLDLLSNVTCLVLIKVFDLGQPDLLIHN